MVAVWGTVWTVVWGKQPIHGETNVFSNRRGRLIHPTALAPTESLIEGINPSLKRLLPNSSHPADYHHTCHYFDSNA